MKPFSAVLETQQLSSSLPHTLSCSPCILDRLKFLSPTRLFSLASLSLFFFIERFISSFVFRSVAVARSRDVPAFGPPIPKDVKFPKSSVFRDFLLTKVINAENAAHKSDKFRAMATRTRHEYLRDLAERHVTSTPIDPSGKFPFISLAHKRKEKSRPYSGAELRSPGCVTWAVYTEDHGTGGELEALLGISNDFLVLVDPEAKSVVFNCAVHDVIGWTLGSPASMKVFYERGESVSLRSVNNNTEDFREVVKRLEVRDEAFSFLSYLDLKNLSWSSERFSAGKQGQSGLCEGSSASYVRFYRTLDDDVLLV